eukprot:310507_1
MLFLFNWLNDIGSLWSALLASCIGWSLLTPNQATDVDVQLQYALFGTIIFLTFGLWSNNFKQKQQNKILDEMKIIKNDKNERKKESKLMERTRKLVLYDRMIEIYNVAFALSVSYAWESFAGLALESSFYEYSGYELFG